MKIGEKVESERGVEGGTAAFSAQAEF